MDMDKYNIVGAGDVMKTGVTTSEGQGRPGMSNAVKGPSGWGKGGGVEEIRPGGSQKVMESPSESSTSAGGFPTAGGPESISWG